MSYKRMDEAQQHPGKTESLKAAEIEQSERKNRKTPGTGMILSLDQQAATKEG